MSTYLPTFGFIGCNWQTHLALKASDEASQKYQAGEAIGEARKGYAYWNYGKHFGKKQVGFNVLRLVSFIPILSQIIGAVRIYDVATSNCPYDREWKVVRGVFEIMNITPILLIVDAILSLIPPPKKEVEDYLKGFNKNMDLIVCSIMISAV